MFGQPFLIVLRHDLCKMKFFGLTYFISVEHVSIQANKLIVAVNCRGSLDEGFKHFSVNMSFTVFFSIIDYSPYLGILFQLINTRMAFAWTFLDLFIILISCSLAVRFRQVNERVLCMRNMKVYYKDDIQ